MRTTHDAIGPAQVDHELVAAIVVLKVSNGLNQSASGFHRKDYDNRRLVCQVY